jgi:hypothetical protein
VQRNVVAVTRVYSAAKPTPFGVVQVEGGAEAGLLYFLWHQLMKITLGKVRVTSKIANVSVNQ